MHIYRDRQIYKQIDIDMSISYNAHFLGLSVALNIV